MTICCIALASASIHGRTCHRDARTQPILKKYHRRRRNRLIVAPGDRRVDYTAIVAQYDIESARRQTA
jgi:hypothetical protein